MERESWNLDLMDYLRYKMRQDFDNASLHDAKQLIDRYKSWNLPFLRDEIKGMVADLKNEEAYYRQRNLESV